MLRTPLHVLIFLVCCALLFCGLKLAGAQPPPFPAVWVSPGDSGTVKLHYSLATPLPATDTVQLRLGRDSVAGYGKMLVLTARRTAQRDSAAFASQRIYGARVKWYGCRRVLRAGVQIVAEKCATWFTNLPPRVPDSVWVDTTLALKRLEVKPERVSLTWGQVQQFCAFLVFRDGKVAMRAQDRAIAECPPMYSRYSAAVRAVSTAQQVTADRTCIAWRATGGNIIAETCPTTLLRGWAG